MARGYVSDLWAGYVDPRRAMARRLARGSSERHALRDLFVACGLGFVASMPNAVREASRVEVADPLAAVVSAHLFGYLFVLPLLLYGLAALLHLVARGFGGRGGFLGARTALFWSAVLAGPLALALALVGAASEVVGTTRLSTLASYVGYGALAFWLWLFAANLAEAEGFGPTRRVAAALVAGASALGLGALAVAGGAAG